MPVIPVVSVESVRDMVAGENLSAYLSALGTTEQQDAKIAKEIPFAQSEVERMAQTHLTRRVIKSRPAGNKPDGTPSVKGVDYDYEEDAYNWYPADWNNGFAQVRLRRRPIQSVERVVIRYGQHSPQTVLLLPEQWIVADHKLGIIHILPIVGIGSAQATGLVLLPILGHGINRSNAMVPAIATIDYTAGYLPADFNPETDDIWDANPDQDAHGLVEAVKYLAAKRVLLKVQQQIDANGGTISLDGFSESVQAGLLHGAIESLETQGHNIIDSYNDEGPLNIAVI